MQVSVEAQQGLERKVTVTLPEAEFAAAVEQRLKSLLKDIRIPGFRPGKAPAKVVRQRFGKDIQQEVVGDMIKQYYPAAIQQEKLQPAGMPTIDVDIPKSGMDFSFTATFEVYPEVKLTEFTQIKVSRPEVELTETDIDNMLAKLRKQKAAWVTVEQPAELTNQIKINFTGKIDGEAFPGGSAEDFAIVLGSGRMIPGFEEQLLGIKAGESRTIQVTFPDDYQTESLRGKLAEFAVICNSVAQEQLPEITPEFIQEFGVPDGELAKLRERLQQQLQKELANRVKNHLTQQIIQQLLDLHDIQLPQAVINQQIDELQQKTLRSWGIQPGQKVPELPKEPFQEEAGRRAKTGFLIAEIIKRDQLKADPAKIEEKLDEMIKDYEDPKRVAEYMRSSKQIMENLELAVLEQMVMDHILKSADVTAKQMTFDELMELEKAA